MQKDQSKYWSQKPAKELPVNDFAKELIATIGDGKRILDLGCGYGADAIYFAENGHTVTALDFSASSVERVKEGAAEKKLITITPVQHDITEPLPFDDSSFDVVYAHLSIHYFDDETTEKIVGEIHRILESGGHFFVKCKSVDDPLYGVGEKVGEDMYKREHVRHFFSEEYMREKLHHFSNIEIRKTESEYWDKKAAFIEATAESSRSHPPPSAHPLSQRRAHLPLS